MYYTLDGSRPDYTSPRVELSGTREGAEDLTITSSTTVKWFSADLAGNVEGNYEPLGDGGGFKSKLVTVKRLR